MSIGKIIVIGGIAVTLAVVSNFLDTKQKAVTKARTYYTGKGIANLGSGCSRTGTSQQICHLPEIAANIDHIPDGPKMIIADLDGKRLPFTDGQFDVALASHVLEHMQHWQESLTEWSRIADHVIVVLPQPIDLTSWIHPDHKQHFSFADMAAMPRRWPKVEVFS